MVKLNAARVAAATAASVGLIVAVGGVAGASYHNYGSNHKHHDSTAITLSANLSKNQTVNQNKSDVNNLTGQESESGDVKAQGNLGAVGSARSGDARNDNRTMVTVTNSNRSDSNNWTTNSNNNSSDGRGNSLTASLNGSSNDTYGSNSTTVNNATLQSAKSGDVKAQGNLGAVGNLSSGAASNSNSTTVNVSNSNTSSSANHTTSTNNN